MHDNIFIRLSAADNVIVLPRGGRAGDVFENMTLRADAPPFHKAAAYDIDADAPVIKYGRAIGRAARDIKRGEWVHEHNMYSRVAPGDARPAQWKGPYPRDGGKATTSFMGYRRQFGTRPGVRNDLWIIPASASVIGELRHVVSQYHKPYWIDSVKLLHFPFVRDGRDTRELYELEDMAVGLALNPNAAGVLFAGLQRDEDAMTGMCGRAIAAGCNALCSMLDRDEPDAASCSLDELAASAPRVRELFPASRLCVGLSAASGAASGVSANPLLSRAADALTAQGAVALAAGVPELFAADEAISGRMTSRETYDAFASLAASAEAVSGPQADDWENGITTPEERALSALPAVGSCQVAGILSRGETATAAAGLQITPGCRDEAVNCTMFAASGTQIILFATSRGEPFGSLSPTLKIAATHEAAANRPEWTDFDAGAIMDGEPMDSVAGRLHEHILRVANGERASHERRGVGDAVFGTMVNMRAVKISDDG
jgi:altronate hydrolase